MNPPGPGLSLAEGMRLSRLTVYELWLAYFAVGGDGEIVEIEAYAYGALRPCGYQHNLIAQALNEHFLDTGTGQRVAYQDLEFLLRSPPRASPFPAPPTATRRETGLDATGDQSGNDQLSCDRGLCPGQGSRFTTPTY